MDYIAHVTAGPIVNHSSSDWFRDFSGTVPPSLGQFDINIKPLPGREARPPSPAAAASECSGGVMEGDEHMVGEYIEVGGRVSIRGESVVVTPPSTMCDTTCYTREHATIAKKRQEYEKPC